MIKKQTVCHLVQLLYPPRHAGPTGTLLRKNYWLNHAAPLQPIDYNGVYLKKLMQSRLIAGLFRAFSGVKMAKTRSGENGFVIDSKAIL